MLFEIFGLSLTTLIALCQVVNRLRKEYVYETLRDYGVHYDKTWIYDKIHHEINQFCSSHSLQQVYIDVFDQVIKDARKKKKKKLKRNHALPFYFSRQWY